MLETSTFPTSKILQVALTEAAASGQNIQPGASDTKTLPHIYHYIDEDVQLHTK